MTPDPAIDPHWVLDSLEQLREMVVLTDAGLGGEGPRVTYVNAAFEQATGWPRREVLGRSLRLLQGPGTDRATLDRIRDAVRRGESVQAELINYRRDGAEYWLRLHIQPIRDANGALVGFISLQSDISAERRREAETHRLGEWFESAAASALTALYLLTAVSDDAGETSDFRFAYANRTGGSLLDTAPDALVGRTLREALPPSRRELLIEHCRQVLASGRPRTDEFEVPEFPEDKRWLRHQIVPMSDGVAITSENITARKRAEHDIARREEWFRAAAEGNHNALYINECVRDGNGEVVDFTFAYVNAQGGRLVGMRPEDMIGRSICELFPVNRTDGFFERYKRVFLTQSPHVEEFPISAPGVAASWLRQTEVPWSNGVALSPEDITARKQAEIELRNRETMLQSFLDNCPGLAWINDEHGNTIAWNGAFAIQFQPVGERNAPGSIWELFPAELAKLYYQNNLRVLESGQTQRFLESGQRPDGSVCIYESFKFPLGERNGMRLIGGIAIDITERESERQSAERLAAIVQSSGDAIASLDLRGHFVSWNQGAERLYGYRAAEAIGLHASALAPPEQTEAATAMLARVLAGEPIARYETQHRRKDGGPLHVQLSLSPIVDRDGRIIGISSIATDIGESHRREAQTRYFAEHDPVTGALNERGLLLAAGRLFQQAPDAHFAMLRLSVDRYSEFRDVFGVQHADALAGCVIARMGETLAGRPHEIASIGHNQFAALVSCDAGDIDCLRDHLEQMMRALAAPMDVLGIEVSIAVQCGAARFPDHAAEPEALMRCADLAFGQARRNADHRPVVYDPAMSESVAFQVRLQQELSRAIERGQLRVVMQPIFDDATPARPVGMEALVRWRHPELGDVSPAQFIPVAEESGLIPEIGEYVLREACRQKARLDAAGHSRLFLSVNVSRDQFRRGDLPERVATVLAETGVRADRLELEITEGVLMEHTGESERQLKALNRMGVGLAVDDFGTGYSSLAYLQRFPVTKLKIDRSFVNGLPTDRGASEIVRTILTLAQSLGLEALAEGVENGEQRLALTMLGCRQFQGYLLSRPLEAGQVADFLAQAATAD